MPMSRDRSGRTTREPGYYRRLAHLDSGSDEFYEIDRVVAKKVEKVSFIACITIAMHLNACMVLKGEQRVLVTWKDYPIHTASWEPSTSVTSAALRLVSSY